MADLKLGPLPKVETVRVTVTMPKPLKDTLDLYADEHGKLYEPVEAAALIPYMLDAFLRSDRAFMRRHGKAVRTGEAQAQVRLPAKVATSPPSRERVS